MYYVLLVFVLLYFNVTMLLMLLMSIFITFEGKLSSNYWSTDYDDTKNCKQEKMIIKLQKEKDEHGVMVRCASASGSGDERERWEKCKKRLIDKLVDICDALNIVEVRREQITHLI